MGSVRRSWPRSAVGRRAAGCRGGGPSSPAAATSWGHGRTRCGSRGRRSGVTWRWRRWSSRTSPAVPLGPGRGPGAGREVEGPRRGRGTRPGTRPRTLASLGGWGWSGFLCLGGRVHGEQARVVRLADAAGSAVEDVVEGGSALSIAPRPARRALRVELLDAGARSWPPSPGRPAHAPDACGRPRPRRSGAAPSAGGGGPIRFPRAMGQVLAAGVKRPGPEPPQPTGRRLRRGAAAARALAGASPGVVVAEASQALASPVQPRPSCAPRQARELMSRNYGRSIRRRA
jgi:hypothetical protein